MRVGLLLSLALVIAVSAAFATYQTSSRVRTWAAGKVSRWAAAHGYHGLSKELTGAEAVRLLPARAISSLLPEDLPKIAIDIKFKHFKKLAQKRDDALSRGFLVQGGDDYVPASIRYGDRTVKVKLRLKGDLLDHLQDDKKWSYRIHVKGKGQLFGLRRFSIQHPQARAYQGEQLVFDTLRHLGGLAPRYFFVQVVVNGEDIGVMAVEEHFSKELLEANGRPEGVILKFDESWLWATRGATLNGGPDFPLSPFYSYRNALIGAFRQSRISRSETLSRDYGVAVGLLRSFVAGKMDPSEVFDVDQMGKFLAVAEFWGSNHLINFRNIRFYLNPITAKLEPIGYDASLVSRSAAGAFTAPTWPIGMALLRDSRILEAFRVSLRQIAAGIRGGELGLKLKATEELALGQLHKEFYLVQPFPAEELRKRVDFAERLGSIPARLFYRNPSLLRRSGGIVNADDYARLAPQAARFKDYYPTLVQARVIEQDSIPYLEIAGAVPHAVAVSRIEWVAPEGGKAVAFEPTGQVELPLTLPPTPFRGVSESRRISFVHPTDSQGLELRVSASIAGEERIVITTAMDSFAPLAHHPVPRATIEEALADHPFLTLSEDRKVLSVAPGRWSVHGSIVVPAGVRLAVSAGTTLRFGTSDGIVSRAPLDFRGTQEAPVVLEGRPVLEGEGTWQGIAVLEAGASSKWSHVHVRNTTGTERPGWGLTGGTVFYKSDVEMDHCDLEGNRAEDALNIIHSHFRLTKVQIADTLSDGFDSDFSQGTISGGLFRDIGKAGGGDGVDFSGSKVGITGTVFQDVSDKAISVGERSDVTVTGVVVLRSGTGAASKDGSRLSVADSAFEQIVNAALMAYVKKPEFGPGSIDAKGLRLDRVPSRARVQTGSRIVIDGEPLRESELDVKSLYQTIMKPGLRQ